MNISVKCFATLAKFQPEGCDSFEVADNATPLDVITQLGIDPDEVKIIFINGAHAQADKRLEPSDRLGLFPAVGGG